MNGRSCSSTSDVMSVAASASVRAITTVGTPQTSAASRAEVRVRMCCWVGVGLAGQVGVTGDLPARQVDGLEAGADLLDRLVAGQRAERVDLLQGVQLLPQHLGATAGQGVLLDHGALQRDDVRRGVGAGD